MLRFLVSWLFRLILSHSVGDGNSHNGPCQDYQGLLTWRHQGRGGNSQAGSSGQGEEQSEEGVDGVSREYQRIDHSESEEGERLRQSDGSQGDRSVLARKQTQCLRMKGNLVYEISPPEYHRGRDDCEMCKTQEVDQPKHDHPANEGEMTDKEYADKDDGKKETEDWHHQCVSVYCDYFR